MSGKMNGTLPARGVKALIAFHHGQIAKTPMAPSWGAGPSAGGAVGMGMQSRIS